MNFTNKINSNYLLLFVAIIILAPTTQNLNENFGTEFNYTLAIVLLIIGSVSIISSTVLLEFLKKKQAK